MDVGDQQSRELVFAALADQVRREILDTLASHGECSAGFISEHISSVGRTTVSAHLKALKMSGVIVERRAGRNRFSPWTQPVRPTTLYSFCVMCSSGPWWRHRHPAMRPVPTAPMTPRRKLGLAGARDTGSPRSIDMTVVA